MDDVKTIEHPSQGSVTFSRIQCSGQVTLYGSSLRLNHYIKMEVHESKHKRDLSTDLYHPGKLILSVAMSPTQFAELITSLNYGSGIPCTIEWRDGKVVPKGKFVNKVHEFEDEFSDDMRKLVDKVDAMVDKVADALTRGRTTKKEAEKVLNMIGMLIQDIRSNIPFTYKCFNEQMDKSVQEAKSEIEAYVIHKVNTLGLEALKTDLQVGLLSEGRLETERIE